ncbi:hypothetical protein ACIBKY_26815 [Nonomuraea sp. NPDC050394]|uniref:hypothetical protein n=1 Tax=Nonomuraea sp. NPDC050394 TaxID=3364363 RepID=UPI003793FA3F
MNASSAPWITSAAIIAACALAFTLVSFWWLHVRQGRLKSFEPTTFGAMTERTRAHIRLPVVLFNSGPKPIIVRDLQLRLASGSGKAHILPWHTSRTRLKPSEDDFLDFPAVFSIEGWKGQQIFVQFGMNDGFDGPLAAQDYQASVEAKVGHKEGWVPLLAFTLRGGNIRHPSNFITYSNALKAPEPTGHP